MSKYNVGDIVTTTETLSHWGNPIPTGPKRVCALFELRGEVGIEDIPKTPNRNYVLKVDQVQPYAPTLKPGDVVEVLLDCEDPVYGDKLPAGTRGTYMRRGYDGNDRVSTSAYGDALDGCFVVRPQSLRLVRAAATVIKAGDWVTTDQTSSHYGSKVPPGPLYVHKVYCANSEYNDPERAALGTGTVGTGDEVVVATSYLTPIVMHSVSLAKPEQKDEPKTKAGTGWTFRIPADTQIDGKRVLKELADAGADYAVVSWGKRDDQRLCLVSQRLAERAKAVGVDFREPAFVVTNFDKGYTCIGVAESGTSNYCYVNATTLAELEDYAKRVKAAEKAKRPTTVRVNFGVAK